MATKPTDNPIIIAAAAALIGGAGVGGTTGYFSGGANNAELTLAISEALGPIETRLTAIETATDEDHSRRHFHIECKLGIAPECAQTVTETDPE